jgi:hypothetical protein
MAEPSDPKTQTPGERLAALVAQKKASQGQTHPGARPNERSAAARSASKSKPAAKK